METNLFGSLSLQQLRRAVAIKERIATLEAELGRILGAAPSGAILRRGRRSRRSVAVKARMVAAHRARWARRDGGPSATRVGKGRRRMSAQARARLAAVARARWAKVKAAGKKSLAA